MPRFYSGRNLAKKMRPPTVRVTKNCPEGRVNSLDMMKVGPFASSGPLGDVKYGTETRCINTTGCYGTKSTFAVRGKLLGPQTVIGGDGKSKPGRRLDKKPKAGCRLVSNRQLLIGNKEAIIEAYKGALLLKQFGQVELQDLRRLEVLCQDHIGLGWVDFATKMELRAKSLAGRGWNCLSGEKMRQSHSLIRRVLA